MPPDRLQLFHDKWRAWFTEGHEKGWMLDASTALKTEGRVVNAKKVVTDGPFLESRNIVRGYVNVETDSLDTAAELGKGVRSCCTEAWWKSDPSGRAFLE